MRRKNVILTIYSLFYLLLVGCDGVPSSSDNYMILDKVEYVKKFPQEYTLSNKIEPDINVIGISDFCINDSMLIFATKNTDCLWSFISLPDYNELGCFLTKGNGPYEFVQSPIVSFKTSFFKKQDQLFADIYDFQKGRVLQMDITKSFKTSELHISVLKDSLPPFLFNFIVIDSTKFFCKEANHNHTQQIRYISDKNNKITFPVAEKLNLSSIREGENINILSTITKMNPDNGLFVEMSIGLNYINIYSIDGTFGKTICLGNKLANIDKIQEKKPWNRIYTFADLRLFDNFFGVVCIDEDFQTYQTERKKLPSILLFNWQGEPLAELKMEHFITSFDIDFINGDLYTLDVHSDEFFKYDIRDVLPKLN